MVSARGSAHSIPSSGTKPVKNSPHGNTVWSRFKQQQHQRINKPNIFDEGTLKFEKFSKLSFEEAPEIDKPHLNVGTTLPPISDKTSEKAPIVLTGEDSRNASSPSQRPGVAVEEIGLRKAHFFDHCLRADRALERPRHAPVGALSARESSRTDDLERRNQSKSPTHLLSDNGAHAEYYEQPASDPEQQPVSDKEQELTNDKEQQSSKDRRPTTEKGRRAESMGDFVGSCKQAKIHPVTTGIIRCNADKLQLEYGCTSDSRAEAVSQTLKVYSGEVHEAHFRSNGLTHVGAAHMLSALPDSVQDIDLSQNDLGHNDSWCSSLKPKQKLRSLNVSDSQLGDNTCKSLCEILLLNAHCRSLRSLNLSGNSIFQGATAIAYLIRGHFAIEELDLHWNHITGDSARDLARAIYDNYQAAGKLSSINLAWNPLGKLKGEETCKQLAQVFAENDVLVHMDLYRCELLSHLCRILADGLKDNTTLLGLHLKGNEAYMDTNGFIVPLSDAALPASRSTSPEPKKAGPLNPQLTNTIGATSLSDKIPVLREGDRQLDPCIDRYMSVTQPPSCCWVCESWREERLLYTSGLSGPEVTSDVWVFTSVDGYEAPVKMTKQNDDFVAYIMCPAGELRYIFQVGTEVLTSGTAAHIYDVHPKIVIQRILPKKVSEEDPDACSDANVEVNCLNTRDVVARSLNEPVCQACIPRRIGVIRSGFAPEGPDAKCSLFAPYDEGLERPSFCQKCFDTDWRTTHLPLLIDDDSDRIRLRDALRAYYAEIKVLYTSLCSLGRGLADSSSGIQPMTCGVGMYEYMYMLVAHNLLGENLSLDEAEAQFIMAALPSKQHTQWHPVAQTQGFFLQRHCFFEVLVRLAVAKFAPFLLTDDPGSKTYHKAKVKTAAEALGLLLEKHIMYPYPPMKHNFNCVQWRTHVLHSQCVEAVFRKHKKQIIDPLFKAYSQTGGERLTTSYRFMRLEDWCALIDGIGEFPCQGPNGQMNTWDRVWTWQQSAMSHADELRGSAHLEMIFVEFLEALGRLVGLLHARKKVAEASKQEAERWDLGLGPPTPSSIFCHDKDTIMNSESFAKLMDQFLQSDQPQKALAWRSQQH